jgi:hypothetical protein
MTFEYKYGIYNPGQYPADAQAAWDALVAVGWQVCVAAPAYNEIYILWQREALVPSELGDAPATRDSLGRFQKPSVDLEEDLSGDAHTRGGDDAR